MKSAYIKWEAIKRNAVREFFNISGGNGNINGDVAFLAIVERFFIRCWYRYSGPRPIYGGRRPVEPHIGRKTYLARGVDWARARQLCDVYNSTHNPGPLSRKAEFSS